MLSGRSMEKHSQANIVLFLIVLVEQASTRERFNAPVSNFMGSKQNKLFTYILMKRRSANI